MNEQGADAAGVEAQAEVGFRGPQVCKIVGITYRQLDYWARTDLIRPSLADAQGSGSQRRYSYRDLVALKVIKSLLDAGVSLQTARKAVDYLRGHLGDDLATATLVIQGSQSVLARTDAEFVDIVRQGQGVLSLVPLKPAMEALDATIHDLAPGAVPADAVPITGPTTARGVVGA
jgi:DNA-binding transcriptional MerR regulator